MQLRRHAQRSERQSVTAWSKDHFGYSAHIPAGSKPLHGCLLDGDESLSLGERTGKGTHLAQILSIMAGLEHDAFQLSQVSCQQCVPPIRGRTARGAPDASGSGSEDRT